MCDVSKMSCRLGSCICRVCDVMTLTDALIFTAYSVQVRGSFVPFGLKADHFPGGKGGLDGKVGHFSRRLTSSREMITTTAPLIGSLLQSNYAVLTD